MEYIKNNRGLDKTILVRKNEGKDLETLKKLSLDKDIKVYLLPEDTNVDCNKDGWIVSAKGDINNIWQFIKGWAMPYECFVNGFPFPVKMEEMWRSDKEIEEFPIEKLEWNLELPWWSTDEEIPYNLTPNEVLKDVNLYLDHKKRVENSDIKYPLLLIQTKQNRWLIYDGVHRFIRQILEGRQTVLCQKFLISEIGKYIPEGYKELFKEWCDLRYE